MFLKPCTLNSQAESKIVGTHDINYIRTSVNLFEKSHH